MKYKPWKIPGKAIARVRENLRLPALKDSVQDISAWFDTPLGQHLLQAEHEALKERLNYLFGYHLMQLSSVEQMSFAETSRISHCFKLGASVDTCEYMTPGEKSKAPLRSDEVVGRGDKLGQVRQPQALADFGALPLPDEVVDVSILHHVLEFSDNPHQVLKEAARVTIPRGYVIIVAFNPVSFPGVLQPLGAVCGGSAVMRRKALRVSRMKDWLEFLDFSCAENKHIFHNLPINNARFLSSSHFVEHFLSARKLPMGMSYCIVARKDKAGLTPIKPKWDKASLLGAAMPLPKQAMRAPVRSAEILPFRNRINKRF